jgi:hypothetical protein
MLSVNGVPAALLYVTPNNIVFRAPKETAGLPVTVRVAAVRG